MHREITPRAEKRPKKLEIHGDIRTDDYFWLRERGDRAVISYLKAENDYLAKQMAATKPLQEELFREMKSRIKEKDQSVPVQQDDYLYYTKYEEGSEYPIFCRKKNLAKAPEEVILNGNELALGHNYFQFGQVEASPNHRYLAYSTDVIGRRIYNISLKDLQTGETLPISIEQVTGNLAWASDNETLFFSKMDLETLRSYQIYRKNLFKSTKPELVFQEDDEAFDVWVSRSKTEKYLYIDSSSSTSTEVYFLNAAKPQDQFKSFHPREPQHEYDIVDAGDRFYIYTNWNALNFRVMESPSEPTPKEKWVEVLPHNEDVLIEDVEAFENFLAIEERSGGLPQIRVINRKTKADYTIDFDDPAYVTSLGTNSRYNTDWLRYEYESMTTPESTYEIHMASKERKLLKQKEVLGGFDRRKYESKRLFAPSHDGTMIPISMVYRKDMRKTGPQPLILYGYGSYGLNSEAYFNSNLLSLLDRGFVYAIAHVRGGSEMGRKWYEDGKLLKKKNTFLDFIACAKHLISDSYTSAQQLYATGGSAGGLLMGAVINLEPETFNGVVARVPFVDVVTTMLDESIPLTTFEYEEWGNPSDAKYYNYMKSYSPYDNVSALPYPNLLVTTGLHDSQVQYWEPAKWVSKIRSLSTNDKLVLLHTEMHAGHGGKSGRFESLRETALVYSFFIGLEEKLLGEK